jgi:hypothetical protein
VDEPDPEQIKKDMERLQLIKEKRWAPNTSHPTIVLAALGAMLSLPS